MTAPSKRWSPRNSDPDIPHSNSWAKKPTTSPPSSRMHQPSSSTQSTAP
ncbi:myo-inositol monophosphatase [Histoplasma capsulatum G186AR]|uniref:Myo-inositol monophosphatase n=1 Tax=Ajellomyces capsulatus TaxID=5037 RepID=A0A8H7YTE7_AJECA|nr:myo-inositol monophosphatase [Histoplasma capsulatum]QSS73809.1 myo-inositol monophosphatase [Histoplasma capsulatum G186AR]